MVDQRCVGRDGEDGGEEAQPGYAVVKLPRRGLADWFLSGYCGYCGYWLVLGEDYSAGEFMSSTGGVG